MKGYVTTAVLLLGLVWVLGISPAVGAGKNAVSTKPPAVKKSSAKAQPFLAQVWRNKKNREMLGLTADQVQALEEVLKDTAVKRRSFAQRVKMAQEEFDRLMTKGKFDAARLKTLTDEMVAARAGLIRIRVKVGVSISEILTPAQVEKILKKDPKTFHFERRLLGRRAPITSKKSVQN